MRDFWAWILRPFLPPRVWYRRLYLFTRHWRRQAHQARIDADFACQDCGEQRTRNHFIVLDVHHLSYDRLWREKPGDLVVLCRHCHDRLHRREK